MNEKFARLGDLRQAALPVIRLIVYYGALVGLYFLLTKTSPWFHQQLAEPGPIPLGAGKGDFLQTISESEPVGEAGAVAFLTMAATLLLALPVVWVYTFARQKRGFQQSLAQTLFILAIVVAVVVVLV
jgi:hypothetical protein